MSQSDFQNDSTSVVAAPSWQFVQQLLSDLEDRRGVLPGWSRNAEALCAAVADDSSDAARVAALCAGNAEASMRILNVANATQFARGGKPLHDLHQAVRRMSRDLVRAAIYGWALGQLRFAPRLAPIRPALNALWQEGTLVAAVARQLALRGAALDPDSATLAGIVHNLGKYYLLAHIDPEDVLLGDETIRGQLLADWHPAIGSRLAVNWKLPPAISEAIAKLDTAGLDQPTGGGLAGVLAAAIVAAESALKTAAASGSTNSSANTSISQSASHLATFSAFGLGAQDWQQLLLRAESDAASLRGLLGD